MTAHSRISRTRKPQHDAVVWLQHGEPMLFSKGAKGLRLDRGALELEVVEVADGDWQAAGVLVHDETNRVIAQLLIDMTSGLSLSPSASSIAIR